MALLTRARSRIPHSQFLPTASYPYPSEGRQNKNHNHIKLTKLISWIAALSNSVKIWAMPCRATQDGWVILDSSDKMSTKEDDDKPLQYFCLENPMSSVKRQKDMTLKYELPRSVGAQYAATEDQWRNNSRRNEETGQNKNNTQGWMWLVMEVKLNAVKNNTV